MNLRLWLRTPRPAVWAALGTIAVATLAGATVRDITRVHGTHATRQAACARVAGETARQGDDGPVRRALLAVDMATDKCAALARVSPRLVHVAITTPTPEGELR